MDDSLPHDPDAAPLNDEAQPAKSLGPLRMIWKAALAYPKQIAFALLALLVTASATLAIPAGFKLVIDEGLAAGGSPEDIGRWFEYLLLIVLVLAIATAFRFYFVSWLGERVVADVRHQVQSNLLRMAPGFFEENSPKEISSRMTSDTALIEQVVGTSVSVALRNSLMGIGGTIRLFFIAPTLTLGLLVAIPLIILPIVWFGRKLRTVSRTSQDRVANVGAMVSETLDAMKIVQAFNQEAREGERFRTAVEATFGVAKRRILIRAVMTSVVILLLMGGITLLIWQGALGVASGTVSGGTIADFVITAMIVASSFGSLTETYGDLLRGAGAASRLNELLNERPTIAAPARPLALPEPPRGRIEFDSVSFRYPDPAGNRRAARFQSGSGTG